MTAHLACLHHLIFRSIPRTESVLVMTNTIIFLSCTALASMLGRSGLAILHRIASEGFARQQQQQGYVVSPSRFAQMYGSDRLLADCESGRFTRLLRLTGELLGILLAAPLYSWSTSQERPSPFDASFAFFVASLVTFVLYVSSFALHLNVVGEFAAHPRGNGCGGEANARRCCSFVGEVVSVSAGDMASLFEEGNWSSCSLLGHSRGKNESQKPMDQSARRITKKI